MDILSKKDLSWKSALDSALINYAAKYAATGNPGYKITEFEEKSAMWFTAKFFNLLALISKSSSPGELCSKAIKVLKGGSNHPRVSRIIVALLFEINREYNLSDKPNILSFFEKVALQNPDLEVNPTERAKIKETMVKVISLCIKHYNQNREITGPNSISVMEQAIKMKVPNAQKILGIFYYHGIGVQQNHTRSLELLTPLLKKREIDVAAYVAYIYMSGDGVAINLENSAKLIRQILDTGDPSILGNLLQRAKTDKNVRAVLEMLKTSVNL